MKLACPACNAEFTLDVLLSNVAARESMMHALALPAPLGKLLLAYLGCFRPAKRQLSWERVAAILAELRQPIDAAQVTRNGRVWPAPLAYWQQGLETVLLARDGGMLSLPLKSHGYLFEVIAGVANKGEAKAEFSNEARRGGSTSVGGSIAHVPAPLTRVPGAVEMPQAMQAQLKRKPKGDL